MSFGYSVGDFIVLTQLAWRVVQNSRKACGAHDELTREVTSLHVVLRRLEVEVSKPASILTQRDDGLDRKEELAQLSDDCRRLLRTLDGILEKYNALSDEKRSAMKLWKKVKFGNGEILDLAEIRLKLSTSTSALTLFLNLLSIGSQGKVETYMESQGDELREMRRSLNWITASMQAKAPKASEGSILTTYAGDDKAIWKDFRRELIKEGFSSNILRKHKETIKGYVMELGSRGALDDADISDGAGTEDRETLDATIGILKNERLYSPEDPDSKTPSSDRSKDELAILNQVCTPTFFQSTSAQDRKNNVKGWQRYTNHGNPTVILESNDAASLKSDESQPHDSNHTSNTILAADQPDLVELSTSSNTNIILDSGTSNPSKANTSKVKVNGRDYESVKALISKDQTIQSSKRPQRSGIDSKSSLDDQNIAPAYWFYALPKELVEIFPKCLGPLFRYVRWEEAALWYMMQALTTNPDNARFNSDSELVHYWISSSARIHDNLQLSVPHPSTHHPELLWPLAHELRCLMFRASIYHCRTRSFIHLLDPENAKLLRFRTRYLRIRNEFFALIKLSLDNLTGNTKEASESRHEKTTNALVDPRDIICFRLSRELGPGLLFRSYWEASYKERKERDTVIPKQALFELGIEDSMKLMEILFLEDTSLVGSHSKGVRQPKLDDFIPKLQALLLFFTHHCEDLLLNMEFHNFRRHYLFRTFSVQKHELLDPSIANAVEELENAAQAVRDWSAQHVERDEHGKARPFARSSISLNMVLERRDDARAKLDNLREEFVLQTAQSVPLPT